MIKIQGSREPKSLSGENLGSDAGI